MVSISSLVLLTIFSGCWCAVVRRSAECPILSSFPGSQLKNISALGIAVLLESSEDIGGLVQAGCDPNYAGTFLPTTTSKCANPILEKLGINCTRKIDLIGYTPIIIATLTGSLPSVKALAAIPGIDLDSSPELLDSPIYNAATKGNLEMVRVLSEAGAYLDNPGGPQNVSPLAAAIILGHDEVVNYLLSQQVDVNFREGENGRSPVYVAAEVGRLDILKNLERRGGDLSLLGGSNKVPPINIAAQKGQLKVVDYLIRKGVDLNKQGIAGDGAVFWAAFGNHVDVLKSLNRAGANLDLTVKEGGYTPLAMAILQGNTKSALFLIKNGADKNKKSSSGSTPAFIAAQEGNVPVLQALSDVNADLETPGGPSNITPLMIATLFEHEDAVEFLLNQGVQKDFRDSKDLTALDYARQYGYDNIVRLLEK